MKSELRLGCQQSNERTESPTAGGVVGLGTSHAAPGRAPTPLKLGADFRP